MALLADSELEQDPTMAPLALLELLELEQDSTMAPLPLPLLL